MDLRRARGRGPDIFFSDLVRDVFTLFVNQRKGFIVDRSFPSGLGQASVGHNGWSTKILDPDDDGWKDVFVAGSHVVDNVALYNPTGRYEEGCFLYRNLGDGRFEDLSTRVGADLAVPGAWRGVAVADFDNDGTLGVAVSRLNGTAALFVKRGGAANHWIELDLEGRRSNRDGIGARVRLALPSGRSLYEHVTTANGIYSASDKRVHLGLGAETAITFLEISWPSGIVQRIEAPAVDQRLRVVEPQQSGRPSERRDRHPARGGGSASCCWRRCRSSSRPPTSEPGTPSRRSGISTSIRG